MIRSFRESDCEVLIPLVQADKHMQPDEIRERLASNTSWVYDDGMVRGCAVLTSTRETFRGKQVSVWLYTAPEERGKGTGRALWDVVAEHLAGLDVDTVGTGYRSDKGDAPGFFARRGFTYWFSSHLMGYDGPNLPGIGLDVIPYCEDLFDDYVRLTNEGFLELRQVNDIHPYECYPAGFDAAAERKELQGSADSIYFFQHNGDIVGMVTLGSNYIDNLVVDKRHQRKGYGRQIMQFSINRLRERGVQRVVLGVVDTNTEARRLYESMDFTLVETHTFARKHS